MTISIKIVNIDHCIRSPGALDRAYSPFCDKDLSKVPVIRIFGSTNSGQKACLYIHQVYPYFFVPYNIPENHTTKDIQRDIFQFGTNLNQAFDMTQTNTTENQQHIAAIVLVKAIPFYGYHTDYATYLKIYLIDPAEKQVMVNLLQSQALGVHYQPYEAHLPFVLQFLIDHNLYCMDQIHLDSAQYRPQNERESYCELELDATSMSIKNRWHLKEREIKEEPKTYLQSLESIWDKSLSEQQQSRVKPKRKRSPGQIMTAFEAIEALYPNEYYEQQLSFASENYEAWKVEESKVDLDLMDSYLEEMSAIESQLQEDMERQNEPELQDELEFQKELELQGELGLEDELDLQNELELQDDFGSGDLALWMKEAEKHEKSKHPVVTIEYEESDYEPLATQIQKNDAIFHNEKRVKDDEPFHISEIPPDILSRPTRFLKKFRLNQLDGASGYVKKKSQPSAKAQWDKEMRLLRQMRRKRKSPDKVDDGEMDVWVDIKKSPIFGRKKQKTLNKLKAQRREESAKIELSKLKARKQESRKIELDKGQQKTREEPKNDVAKSKMPKSEVPKIVETKTVEPESRDEVLQKTNEQDAQTQNNFGFLDTLDDFWSSPDTDPVPQLPTEASCSWKTYDQKSKDVMSSSYKPTIPNENTAQKEYVYRKAPPVLKETDPILMRRSHVTYKEPFYSKPSDVPRYPTVYNGKEFKLKCNTINSLKEFNTIYSENMEKDDEAREKVSIRHWMPAVPPPSFQQVKSWLEERKVKPKKNSAAGTQLDGPSIDGTFDFKYMASRPVAKTKHANDHVSFFSLEIHVHTRDDLLPDPEQDPVEIIFYCLQTDDPKISINGYQQDYHVGIIALTDLDITKMGISTSRADINYGETEKELILILIEKIRLYNPDMLVGYEVQNASWGYLIERSALLGIHLVDALSRINTPPSDMIRRDKWGYKKASTYKICGRHMLNVWRLMRHELTLMSYTFENVVYHLLHHRVPHFSHSTLTSWYNKGPVVLKHRLLKYYMKRVQMNLDILDASQVINRTCESARIFGMDFYSVLTRGSQFKVESLMFRIAKPENLLMVSPSRKQVAEQRSLECLPLVMEPVSKFYSSPMAVLDFQSLYPSIMIAHNYCYSTCLGRVRKPGESMRLGVLESYDLSDDLMKSLESQINISPNGIMFVKPQVRKSLLGKMLQELLNARTMVKKLMKDHKNDSGLLRTLDAKQLTLKFIANVTYGYTAASFSGRMPSVDIGDSIVQTGRATLEKAINLINSTEKWGARVVYGDTDSVFVYFEGKSREEAFVLSQEIADTVTNLNPSPIKLKFEKIYHPAVLLAKKRYVGFKYEHPEDKKPIYEAKGIETVRRDHTPATQKILESSLKILFRTQDMSQLKEYLYTQWEKILSNRVTLKDFIIAKEVRMDTYSNRGGPNGALVAQAKMNEDSRAEPQYGERVPYVVVYKSPGAKLKDKVIRPETVLNDSTLRLDADYYIRKQIIAPISRVFNLIGVDIMAWYDNMPRSQKAAFLRQGEYPNKPNAKKAKLIDQYYAKSHCVVCNTLTDQVLCETCTSEPHKTIYTLTSRQTLSQSKLRKLLNVCQDCSNLSALDAITVCEADYADVPCDSLDCPVYYERLKAKKDVTATSSYDNLINEL